MCVLASVHGLQLTKLFNIFCSRWDIFLKLFWDIPRIFLDYLQIILNFLYVCQSVSCLIFLLKLGQYRYISCTGWVISLKLFGNIPGNFLVNFQIIPNFFYVCQLVSWLTSLLKLGWYRDISGSWWDIILNFLETFSGYFWTISKLFWIFCMCISLLDGLFSYQN